MSGTNVKAVIKTRKAAKSPKKAAQNAAVEQALANTPVEMVPFSQLALSPVNVRKAEPDAAKLQELADSITGACCDAFAAVGARDCDRKNVRRVSDISVSADLGAPTRIFAEKISR